MYLVWTHFLLYLLPYVADSRSSSQSHPSLLPDILLFFTFFRFYTFLVLYFLHCFLLSSLFFTFFPVLYFFPILYFLPCSLLSSFFFTFFLALYFLSCSLLYFYLFYLFLDRVFYIRICSILRKTPGISASS